MTLLQDAIGRTTAESLAERAGLFWVLIGVQSSSGDLAAAKASLERLRDIAATDPALQAKVHLALGDVEEKLGNRNQAAWERARARELQQNPQ